ncbi:unnamed protein product [Coffea canephora]|uniref:DH200=94 genomic scaffold, scaffold_1829 n=1 Tax=Coffea canephora TaxID=49390 RepID=A0A068VMC3_COFCA|nr:unnamed protein product [Coffea canephora]
MGTSAYPTQISRIYPFACSNSIKTCNSYHYQHNGFKKEQIASYYSVNTSQIRPITDNNRNDYLVTVPLVSPAGGLATQLATGFNGTTFAFPNALDIDQANQIVYFTDAGAIFFSRNLSTIIQSNDTSGKLYKYDARTKTLSLLLNGLSGPLGVARVRRYWVSGPKAGFSEILVNLPGSPDNIKRTISGDFFAAVTILNRQTFQTTSSVGQRINGDLGIVEATVNLTAQYTNNLISEVQEFLGKLYIGPSTASFVSVYGP